MTTRRFEFSDDKSNKFWEITVDGAEHTVRYGRMGTDGQSKTKSFEDAEAAAKDADKLIKSKTKKGYEEVAGDGDGGSEPSDKVWALLSGLCKTDEDNAILKNICSFVTDVSDDTICIEHDGYDWEVEYEPASEVVYNDFTPKSFSAIAGVVSALTWDGGGPEVGYAVNDKGASLADEWLFDEWAYDDEEEAERIRAAGDITASFCAGQNGLFFDPTTKLSNGEMAMAFLSHEGGGWEPCDSVKHLDYGQILLRLLSDSMVSTSHVKEPYF